MIELKVEHCWGGGERFYFRITFPEGKREIVEGYNWTRKQAKEALDIAEHVYHLPRRKVRFKHLN